MTDLPELFPGFATRQFRTEGADIFARIGGSGPPLVLLHGYPETHACWHKIASELASRFTLVLPDLRGYGQSSTPPGDTGHLVYSKRAMGRDIFQLMSELGFERFALVGHDRGGRVAYRMALDEPARIEKLALLDIISTHDMWRTLDMTLALTTYHWQFLAQPAPMPERLIAADPVYYLEHTLASWTAKKDLSAFNHDALIHYRTFFSQKDRIHSCCEDYRAGAGCDNEFDEVDKIAGHQIECPVLVLWGNTGIPASGASPLDRWRSWCTDVQGRAIQSGHFLAEENPQETLSALLPFLTNENR